MTRINAFRSMNHTNSLAWGKNAGALVFAAVLIICSVTVGCSSSSNDKPKPVSSNHQIPVPQAQTPVMPAPVLQAETKPVQKKAVPRKPATVNYTDKTYGLTFEYPRRYAIETGDAASQLVMSNPIPMNFVQPGGVALAAVELPETNYTNTDFSSAFFNVSVNKALTADQCTEFAVPQPKSFVVTPAAKSDSTASSDSSKPVVASSTEAQPAATQPEPASNSKLMLGDLELRATEAVSGEGTRQSDSKYFHVFQNGSCYEFALNVTTDASEEGLVKHVDRDKIFSRLEQILSTVKINPVTPETVAETPAPAPATGTPAQ